MAQNVVAASVLTAGLRSDFVNTYQKYYEGVQAGIGDCIKLDVPSDKLTEIYGYFLSAPYPRRWDRGEEISSKAFKSVQFNVTNKDYGIRVPWHIDDRQDDQTHSLRARAADAGRNFAIHDERIFFQMLTDAVDPDLLADVPDAPDGAALYSATDGDGGARFGATGGNIVAGGGVATAAAIRIDIFKAAQRFKLFQDTEGQPLLDDSILNSGIKVFYGVANMQAFSEAFVQGRTVQATASGQASTGAAVSNIVMDSGLKVQLVPTQRIADNDWFVFLPGMPVKPLFKQVRQPIQEYFATMDNSDLARDTKTEYAQWDMRAGYGVMLPYATIKVNN